VLLRKHVSSADVSHQILIICVLLNPEPWVLKSATNLLFRFVAAITDSCIKSATKRHWWDNLDINALEIAKGLWEESQRKQAHAPSKTQADSSPL
jgi:hypothetical protein